MWASMLLSPYLHPKFRSLTVEFYKTPCANARCALAYIPSLVGVASVLAAVLQKGQLSNARRGCALQLGDPMVNTKKSTNKNKATGQKDIIGVNDRNI